MRKVAKIIALFVLLCTGVLGLYNAVNEWSGAQTPLQKSVTLGEVAYGVLGLLSVYGILRAQMWSGRTVVAWGVAVTYVATVAVFAYGGPHVSVLGAVSGGAVTALIAYGTYWATSRESSSSTV